MEIETKTIVQSRKFSMILNFLCLSLSGGQIKFMGVTSGPFVTANIVQSKSRTLGYFQQYHGFTPSRRVLLTIGAVLASATNVNVPRVARRKKTVLLQWFDEHYDAFRPLFDGLVFNDEYGRTFGDVDSIRGYAAEHPEDTDVAHCLSEHFA
jgi:hypothetical protein